MKKILIVDDSRDDAELMAEALLQNGYRVKTLYDGLAATEYCNRKKVDLILLDIQMPMISGIWFCNVFKQKPETKDIPVVMVSAMPEEESKKKTLELGASAYLKKPFRIKSLLSTVEKVI